MDVIKSIVSYAKELGAEVKEKKEKIDIQKIVAERKTFLSKEKLTYHAKLRIDEVKKTVYFFESLIETSTGMSSPGMTVKKESYKIGSGGRQESMFEQQANIFGKKYDYKFDFKTVRTTIEKISTDAGFDFQYQITPKGM